MPDRMACLRARVYADVVQSGTELLQVVKGDFEHAFALPLQEVQELREVCLVGVDGVGREAFLQFEVLGVPLEYLLFLRLICRFSASKSISFFYLCAVFQTLW